MQIQSAGQTQTQAVGQMQQTQTRKMDGSGGGQGNRNGANCTTAAPQPSLLDVNSTFSVSA